MWVCGTPLGAKNDVEAEYNFTLHSTVYCVVLLLHSSAVEATHSCPGVFPNKGNFSSILFVVHI